MLEVVLINMMITLPFSHVLDERRRTSDASGFYPTGASRSPQSRCAVHEVVPRTTMAPRCAERCQRHWCLCQNGNLSFGRHLARRCTKVDCCRGKWGRDGLQIDWR